MPKSRNPKIEFDKLKIYFGNPYTIDIEDVEGEITIFQPEMGDIVDIGEERFYGTLNVFTSNTTSYRLALWELGIDWNEISDFDLFTILYPQIDFEVSKLMFGDLDFSLFELFQRTDDDGNPEVIMKHSETGVVIDEQVYLHMSQYLQTVFNSHPEEKLTDDPILKQWYIKKDQNEIRNKEKRKKQDSSSGLLPIISSCINHPGFKYDIEGLRHMKVFQFFDAVSRLQIYESTTALLKGMYSGFVDTSKIPNESFNFMR